MPAFVVASALSGNPVLDGIDTGDRWSGTITYNRVDPFLTSETSAFSSALPSDFSTDGTGVTEAMWGQVTHALAVMQAYANITYTFTNSLDANYLVSDFYKPSNLDVAGIAGEPGAPPVLALNVRTWDDYYSDQMQQWIVLHEVGHSLGLSHLSDAMPESLDYSQYSIMSYNWADLGDDVEGFGAPLTPMALDVAVLQAKYGAASANAGATTYALTTGTPDLDGGDGTVANGRGYVCVWDTGGADTLSAAGSTSGSILNLNAATLRTSAFASDLADVMTDVAASSRIYGGLIPAAQAEMTDPSLAAGGFFSSLLEGDDRAMAGYTIASGAQIEAAVGGAGDDLIIGNALGNTLTGDLGKDDLYGGSGADTLDGGAGDDQAFGGLGNDSIADGGGSNYLRGDEGDDQLTGGAGFDDINGNMGRDTASGGLGDDWVVGGKDADQLFGETGDDIVYGNIGADNCIGGDGADIVRGGQDSDVVRGEAGNDWLSGDRGDDTITGGTGADVFHSFGGAGVDRVTDFNLAEGDRVQLDPGTTYSVAQAGADTVISMTGGGQMILLGVTASTLTGDWIFGA